MSKPRFSQDTRAFLRLFLVLLLMPVCLRAQQGHGPLKPELWFAPGDDLEVGGKIGHPEYGQLFAPNAPWRTGFDHIDVFQLRPPWVLRVNEQDRKQAFAFLAEHHIKVGAVTGGVLTDGCGMGNEGFGNLRGTDAYPRLMKQLDAPLDYILVDEPLTFGHEYSGKNSCQFSIAETAKRAAESVRIVRKYYPNAKVVMIEAPQDLKGGPAELLEFLHDWRNELGEYPSVVRFDMQWRQDWKRDTPGFVRMLTAQHIPYGVIWDGNIPQAKNGKEWIDSAKGNIAQFRALIPEEPSENVIQSWSPQPDRDLPEGDPSTLAGYLKWFVTTGARSH